jgi:hypothetical protein
LVEQLVVRNNWWYGLGHRWFAVCIIATLG